MALGDLTWFEEAKAFMLDGGWEAGDDVKCAIITNGVVPATGDSTPTISDYTQVASGGNYSNGGISLGNWGTLVSQAAGAAKISSAVNPTWAQHASNPTNAYYGLVYHVASGQALCFIDLAGPYNMTTGTLTITWNAAGLATW